MHEINGNGSAGVGVTEANLSIDDIRQKTEWIGYGFAFDIRKIRR